MSMIPNRPISDQPPMDPEKRPAEATESDPSKPEKRLKSDQFVKVLKGPSYDSKSTIEIGISKLSEEPVTEILQEDTNIYSSKMILEEPRPETAAAFLWKLNQINNQDAGDDSTQIIRANLEAVGDQKKTLFPCWLCQETDHGFFACTKYKRLSQVVSYCMVCNKKTDHNTPDCPNATEDVLKKLRYCQICGKNTDHGTLDCPNEDGFKLLPSGNKIPNVCDLCRKVGHTKDCPLDPDHDLDYDLTGDDDW